MAPPPVTIYVTSLTSQPKVRKHTELLRRSLTGLEIPYTEHDLVMDEEAKIRWQRSKPPGKVVGLPGYLVGGEWVGTMDEFEDAVETQTLETFLKQDLDLDAPSTSTTSNKTGVPAEESTESKAAASAAAGGKRTVQDVELEKLMRDMTDDDLDKLMEELNVVPAGAGAASATAQKQPDVTVTAQHASEPEVTDVKDVKNGEGTSVKTGSDRVIEKLDEDVDVAHSAETTSKDEAKDLGTPRPQAEIQASEVEAATNESGVEAETIGVSAHTGGSEAASEAIQASIEEPRAISDIKDETEEITVIDRLKEELAQDEKEDREIRNALKRE